MTIRHHPQDTTLMAYAAGALPGAISAIIACHLTLCPQCRQAVRNMEFICGVLLERIGASGGPVPRMPELPEILSAEAPRAQHEAGMLPLPLARFLGMEIENIRWKQIVKGFAQHKIKLPRGSGDLRILKARPKLKLLAHTHRGMELTMVLKGSYHDVTGEYCRGDVSDLAEDIEHQPRVGAEDECICLIASEKPPRYSDFRARLMRPFMGY